MDSFLVFNEGSYMIYVEPGIEAEKENVTLGLETNISKDWFTIDGINRFP